MLAYATAVRLDQIHIDLRIRAQLLSTGSVHAPL